MIRDAHAHIMLALTGELLRIKPPMLCGLKSMGRQDAIFAWHRRRRRRLSRTSVELWPPARGCYVMGVMEFNLTLRDH